MKEHYTKYDTAEHLKTEEDMVKYLKAVIEKADGDVAFIEKAIHVIIRAIKGV